MAVKVGQRLGSYELVAPLGAGGMGEVFVARDTRLDRRVALKVLPARLASDPAALGRFEREAKALAALSHPSILSIFDFGREGDVAYAVMELVEGRTLRELLGDGRLPVRRAADIGAKIALGLAAAHEKGIVHRDLKPENVIVSPTGQVKILDFGLAKSALPLPGDDQTTAVAGQLLTGEGTLLGTVGYMAPEQVTGRPADARSDIFALGVVLYEMLCGERPFRGASGIETLNAILKEDAPDFAPTLRGAVPPALERVMRRCLEKEPERRFQSARDLAFGLEHVDSTSSATTGVALPRPAPRRRTGLLVAVAAVVVVLAIAAGVQLTRRPAASAALAFHQLTHERGTLGTARFIPGSQEVLYGARWGAAGEQWFARRLDQPGTREISGGAGPLLSLSPHGDALGLGDPYLSHGLQVGRLFSVPLTGGAARDWADAVWAASQGDQPGDIAVATGSYGGEISVEWPPGRRVLGGVGTKRLLRIRGDRLALFTESKDTMEDGVIVVIERGGGVTNVATLRGVTGLAWGPGGREIWGSTYRDGESRFIAVDMKGNQRPLLQHAGRFELQDVDDNGRVLAVLHSYQRQTLGHREGELVDRDLGWLDAQASMAISGDGTSVLLAPLGDWSRVAGRLYVRSIDGGPARDIGPGQRQPTLTRDGRWVATCAQEQEFSVTFIPTGAGTPRTVPLPGFRDSDVRVDLLPDTHHAVVWGRLDQAPFALYMLDLDTKVLRKVSEDGVSPFAFQALVSPVGQWVAVVKAARTPDGSMPILVMHPDGSAAHQALSLPRGLAISGWTADSTGLFVWNRDGIPARVQRYDLATGRPAPMFVVQPPDPVGVPGIQGLHVALDGKAYAYNVTRRLSELFLVEGLR